MYTLFISTYNELVIIGLLQNNKLISRKEKLSDKGHSTTLVPTIKEILDENKLDTKDLSLILVVNGPGSFTGVRLGVTVAKTLSYTLNIPIKTITSIEAIGVSINNDNKIVTIDDSKGKYIGKFENNNLIELIYLYKENALKYLKENNNYIVSDTNELDIEAIYKYSLNLKETPAHRVKAIYVKEIDALNGK